MIKEEDLQEQYAKMETSDLLEIASDKSGYTELAHSLAIKELKRRSVPEEQIRKYQPTANKIDELTLKNCCF